jgi:hypothetical protein
MENQAPLQENQIKMSDELILEIQALRDELTQNVVRIGRLNVQLSFYRKDMEIINNELNSLYQAAESISIKEDDIQRKVVEQYGGGKLDFETGIFTKE